MCKVHSSLWVTVTGWIYMSAPFLKPPKLKILALFLVSRHLTNVCRLNESVCEWFLSGLNRQKREIRKKKGQEEMREVSVVYPKWENECRPWENECRPWKICSHYSQWVESWGDLAGGGGGGRTPHLKVRMKKLLGRWIKEQQRKVSASLCAYYLQWHLYTMFNKKI